MSSISCAAAVACSSSAFQISHVLLDTLLKANQQKLESLHSKVTGEGKISLPAPFYFLAVRNRTQVHVGTHRLTEEVSEEWRKNSPP